MAPDRSLRELDFPLNVYAHALWLEEGRADYLHYGLFERPDMPVAEAQARSTELILARLPEPPYRILEVGVGLGTTLGLLAARGYQVTGITPDPHQAAIARDRAGPGAEVRCARFEELEVEPASLDLVLFQESAQYIDPLVLFGRAHGLLREGGRVLILDEVALRRDPGMAKELHLRQHLIAVAQRCGFDLREQADLSSQAAPTLEYLQRVVCKHRPRLQADLACGDGELGGLDASNRRYLERYRRGYYGYALLDLVKKQEPGWRVSHLEEGQIPQLLALFGEVFGHRMSRELWRWKYGAGRGKAAVAWQGSRMVAHYGGMTRAIRYFGEPSLACQVGDVMVQASERASLSRQGPFFRCCATFLETSIGFGQSHLLGFGFPTTRAMRVAERLKLYAEVDRMVDLRWPAMRGRPRLATRIRPLDPMRDRDAVERLWTEMARDLKDCIVGVRDAAYLAHRYLAHPHRRYELFLVRNRLGGQPLGILVLRRDTDDCWLLDVIAPLRAIPLLVMHARRVAARMGLASLHGWITERNAPLFLTAGGEAHPLDVRIPTSAWTPGPSPEELRGRWWLMGGDTDFL